MGTTLIHLSDIHYNTGNSENHELVFHSLLEDIEKKINNTPDTDFYLVLSGDAVRSGDDSEAYANLCELLDTRLESMGIPKGKRICVPGNHDICRSEVNSILADHSSIVNQDFTETNFNNYVNKCNSVFKSKFNTYFQFEQDFLGESKLSASITGYHQKLSEDIGIYCVNSAFLSSGGLNDIDGKQLNDKGKLAVGTRNLHSWVRESDAQCKILIMHHPLPWLQDWAQREIDTLLKNDFCLFLHGHSHEQDAFYSIDRGNSLVRLSAPPLFTKKNDLLGYSFITLCPEKSSVGKIHYKQWTKRYNFVNGGSFSCTDDGKLHIIPSNTSKAKNIPQPDYVINYLSSELDNALLTFSSQPVLWVDPIISSKPEHAMNAIEGIKYKTDDLVTGKLESTIIKAPPQFGLSCLAQHLTLQAWQNGTGSRWVYLDARKVTASGHKIRGVVANELKRTGHVIEDVSCIVLDSWKASDMKAIRLLKTVCDVFTDTPIFVMQTVDSNVPISPVDDENIGRTFRVLYLWSLPRERIRLVVADYNNKRFIADEDALTARVINDIDTLNIHRTPLNCLTILKASEADFDENPVNRTEVLHRILFILFNIEEIPTYRSRPDMKDCEHVLGHFAEIMLREEIYTFSREFFLNTISAFCEMQLISIDGHILFDILYKSHIFVRFNSEYAFKFTYWLYYFAAQRMHHDSSFAEFILSDMQYARFPEIMEFYTGIDRRRADAVSILTTDLCSGIEEIKKKCGIPENFNPFSMLKWVASKENLESMQSELKNGVAASNLPEVIKDQYADRDYDRVRPYRQSIRDLLTGHTMNSLMLSISAASRALRNSDYVDPAFRKELLRAILEGWNQVSRVLLVLLPLLAEKCQAVFDGAGFALDGDFGETPTDRFHTILSAIPYNVSRWYQDDLYSSKMMPLVMHVIAEEVDDVVKHEIMLLTIAKRPQNWKNIIMKYVHSLQKNTFYLYDVHAKLREEFQFAFIGDAETRDIEQLIKIVLSKHIHGIKKPKTKAAKRVSDSLLPKRSTT